MELVLVLIKDCTWFDNSL